MMKTKLRLIRKMQFEGNHVPHPIQLMHFITSVFASVSQFVLLYQLKDDTYEIFTHVNKENKVAFKKLLNHAIKSLDDKETKT